jgi:ribosomal protein S12 methylthiotransferase
LKTQKKPADTIQIVTLGCSKNTVDSEKLMRQLSAHSLKVEHENENSKARSVIINTCGFINDAKQESIDTIVNYIQAKQNGTIENLYVMGCLSERYADALREGFPEVDNFFGVNDIKKIIESLGYNYKGDLIGERLLTTPSHYAYLKISEGCNRKCAFCAIPLIRGSYQSTPVEDLIKEASLLAKGGVKELMVIAQDISYYGTDLYEAPLLAYLVEKLSEIKGIEWIRLHYAYPSGFPKDILKVMRDNPKVCKYLDIPFQHISDNMLKKMRRGLNKAKTLQLIDNLRTQVPGIALRTTLLTGHPGETEKDFDELVEFVENTRFERMGVFTYSHEEDTYAALKYKDSIPDKLKLHRADSLMAIQQKISTELNQKRIGQELRVIIDRKEDDYYVGRSEFDSPEVDNEVIVSSDTELQSGNFCKVKITDASEFDLVGGVV